MLIVKRDAKILLLLAAAIFNGSAMAEDRPPSSWVAMPGLTLSQIYFAAAVSIDPEKNRSKYEVIVISTGTLPWPDGRSALVTTLEVVEVSDRTKWLFQCIDFKDANFSDTGEMCYSLKRP